MMDGRSAPVRSICMESVEVEADFPVALGELVRSRDGGWYGQAQSHDGGIARILPLDSPEKLKTGAALDFTGETPDSRIASVEPGTVVDPLGRFIMRVGDAGTDADADFPRAGGNFWGLKSLGGFMSLREGDGVALMGAPPGGFPALFSQIALSQRAAWLYIFCQGGYRDLYRYCRAAQAAGNGARTVILWAPPWASPALKNLAPRFLARLTASRREAGRGLVLIDDLHYWLESVREFGESSGESLLPDGYPYTTRRQLAELLDLKSPPDGNGNSVSLIVGWRYEEGFSASLEHPYLGRLPRFMRTGIVLEEHAEYLVPSDLSWGELSPVGRCWRALRRERENCAEDLRPALTVLAEIFAALFVEYSPLSFIPEGEEAAEFSSDDENSLMSLVGRLQPSDMNELLKLRAELQLHFREPYSIRRRAFLAWLGEASAKEERP